MAIIFAVIYVGFWPLAVTSMILYHTCSVFHSDRRPPSLPWYLSFLREGYRPERGWYEIVWLGLRLLLGLMLSFIADPGSQAAAVILFLTLFTLLHLRLQPYHTKWENSLELLSLVSLLCSYGMLMVTASSVFAWLVVLFLGAVGTFITASFLALLWKPAQVFFSRLIGFELGHAQAHGGEHELPEHHRGERTRLLLEEDAS